MQRLLAIMARLRDPDGGCPWDREQTFATIVPHTLEEAYEVADVIECGDLDALPDELGDLLFQVVFYARLGQEAGLFDFEAVAKRIGDKLVRRHPHVFEDEAKPRDAAVLRELWESGKEREREARSGLDRSGSALDGVARALPALTRAVKLQRRAARVGFDWPDAAGVFGKITEETDEIREALEGDAEPERLADEVGDLLFAAVNLARHLGVEPESALRGASRKFERRFKAMEHLLAGQGRHVRDCSLAELDALWERVKRRAEDPGKG